MNAQILDEIAAAAEEGDWTFAIAKAGSLAGPIHSVELAAMPWLCHRVLWCLTQAGFPLRAEFHRLFSNEFPLTMDLDQFHEQLIDRCFHHATVRMRLLVDDGSWGEAITHLAASMLLPGACQARARLLTKSITHFVYALAKQSEQAAARPFHSSSAREANVLTAIPALIVAVVGCEYYPDMGLHFVTQLLRNANQPIVSRLDAAFVAACWPQLEVILSRPAQGGLYSPSASRWLLQFHFDQGENQQATK